jgi:two-component system, cell cycle sensor histidine kinase and response regulator CckA
MSATILIADDERLLRKTLKRVLSRVGFSVLVAENGEEAVRIFSENKEIIDLCILDLNMPNLNGTEALHQIREIKESANILLASGESKEAVWERCTLFKPDGIIQKPFALDVLLKDIKSYLV